MARWATAYTHLPGVSPDFWFTFFDFMGDSFFSRDSFKTVSIIWDYGFAEYDIIGDSIIAVSIIGDSGFAEYDVIGDSLIEESIIEDYRFAEYDIIGG
jgi:hypothetical protein